jgi:hypothetical protein
MVGRWVAESLAALKPFNHRAEGLRQIAKFILESHSLWRRTHYFLSCSLPIRSER